MSNSPLIITGIGGRQATSQDFIKVRCLASTFKNLGIPITFRSGGAVGIDTYFDKLFTETGSTREVLLPKPYFNSLREREESGYINSSRYFSKGSLKLLVDHHPNFKNIKTDLSIQLLERGGFQVLGKTLDTPSDIVFCVRSGTKVDEKGLVYDCDGGTGQAVRIAYANNIPVVNLRDDAGWSTLPNHLKQIKSMYFYRLTHELRHFNK